MRAKTITPEVAAVLANLTWVDGSTCRINGQLDRKLYTAVNEVLEAAGGAWVRKERVHRFEGDGRAKVAAMQGTGKIKDEKREAEFFETPAELASDMVSVARIRSGQLVLEPSAGLGALVAPALAEGAHVDACELLPENRARLLKAFERRARFQLLGEDFDTFEHAPIYHAVLINPPFARIVEHFWRAYLLLRSGGVLVGIAPSSLLHRQVGDWVELRRCIAAAGGYIEPLPPKTFASAGTNVNTVLVKWPKA